MSVPASGSSPALKKLRALCLGLPEVEETRSWGHPNWKAKGRLFAAFDHYQGKDCICFLAELSLRDVLVRDPRFRDAGFGRGDRTWVALGADGRIDWREVEDLLGRAHRLVTAPKEKAAARKKAKPAARRPRSARPS